MQHGDMRVADPLFRTGGDNRLQRTPACLSSNVCSESIGWLNLEHREFRTAQV